MDYLNLWRKKHKGATNEKDLIIQQMTDNYEEYLSQAPNSYSYEDIQDSSITGQCSIIDVNNANATYDEKFITTSANSKLKVGSVIKIHANHFTFNRWLIRSEENLGVPSHRKFIMYPCNNTLNVLDENGAIIKIPVYAVNQTMYNIGVVKRESSDIYYGDTIMKITLNGDLAEKYVYRGLRYLINVNGRPVAYESTYLDSTQTGILIFQSSEGKLVPEDDLENMIAFNWKENPNFSQCNYEIVGDDPLSKRAEYQILSETLPHSEIDFDFEVDDNTVATVEKTSNKSCILIGLKEGFYVTLKATSHDGSIIVTKDILIKSKEV